MKNSALHIASLGGVVAFVLLALGSGGNGNIPTPDDADYHIRNVSIQGPGHITTTPAQYTVSFEVVVRSNGGAVAPKVSLLDQDDFLRFGDDLLSEKTVTVISGSAPRGIHQHTTTLSLSCSQNFHVIGSPITRDSGEGGRFGGFWPLDFVDVAEVFARVSRGDGSGAISSSIIDVDCSQP